MVTLAAWVYLALLHGRFWRLKFLHLQPPSEPHRKRIAVVIPARDEGATIGAAVASLRPLDVWVVNDNSSDETASLAARAGAAVIHAGPLPPGWTGKLWALSRGVEHALATNPDYLLLTDADIVHSPEALAALVTRAEHERLDLASYMVKLHCATAPERLLIPAFVFFFFLLYPPEWVARQALGTAAAAGGCILVRPEALARIGGIAAIRSELIDDCALARAVKRTGGRIWLGLSDSTRSIRPYTTFAEVRGMIARTAFTQLRYSPLLLLGTVAGMGLLYVAPVVGTLLGDVPSAGAWLLMALLYAPILRFYGLPAIYSLALPAVAMFYVVATIESAWRYWSGRGGTWKGRNQAANAASERPAGG